MSRCRNRDLTRPMGNEGVIYVSIEKRDGDILSAIRDDGVAARNRGSNDACGQVAAIVSDCI